MCVCVYLAGDLSIDNPVEHVPEGGHQIVISQIEYDISDANFQASVLPQ